MVVLVHEFKKVVFTASKKIPFLQDAGFGSVKSILHIEIVGPLGFVKKLEKARIVTYLTLYGGEIDDD